MSTPAKPEPAETDEAAAERLRPLDPRVRRLWHVHDALYALGVAVGGAGLLATLELPGRWVAAAAAAVLALGLPLAAWLPGARYRAWGFRLRERDVLLRRGVLYRTTSVVPYGRIQYVDLRRGPLARLLGLAEIVIHTAGMRGAEVSIPGLDAGEAGALRDRLARLGGADDAV